MNLNFLCCIGAEQKHDQSGMLKMNQVYFYRAYADETMSEILKDNFFNHSESHLKENDIILAYSPNEKDLPKVRWLRIVIPHAGLVKTEKVDNSYLLEVLRQDLADLGDQVAEIEAKIPGSASVINQLATKNQITELQNSKQDVATAVNYDNITNCITEIPQDIKLELANGVITLKAGSKVTFPDGTTYTLTADKNRNSFGSMTDKILLMADTAGNIGADSRISRAGSGATLPADSSTYGTFYNSSDNKIYHWTNGWTPWGVSLPIAIINLENGIATSIDQVFNGFGYIGSTIFSLPGVKGLMPSGRNADGTLKNFLTTTVISTAQVQEQRTNNSIIVNELGQLRTCGGVFNYDTTINRIVSSQGPQNIFLAGTYSADSSGKITSLEPKNAFHAVDYKDFESTVEEINSSISAVDSSAVHKTGNETIGGEKTFTAQRIILQNTNLGKFKEIESRSETSTARLGVLRFTNGSDGISRSVALNVVDNNDSNRGGLVVGVNSSGSLYATSPTPVASSNDTHIATTAWVRTHTSNVVRLVAEQKPTSSNNYTWYRKYSDGWVEQGGVVNTAVTSPNTINLPVAMADANYTPIGLVQSTGNGTGGYTGEGWADRTTTSFKVYGHAASAAITNAYSWAVFGKAA